MCPIVTCPAQIYNDYGKEINGKEIMEKRLLERECGELWKGIKKRD